MEALNVYLLKPVARPEDALDPRRRLVRHEVRDGKRFLGELYVAQGAAASPRWLRYFNDAVDPMPTLKNQSASGLLLMPREAQLYAITFGYGRHFLRPGAWVESFGLRVTLNSIDPASIRSLERKTFDAISRLTKTQAIREGTAAQFGVDAEQDLLLAITGRSTDPRLGMRLSGADALVLAAPSRVRDVRARLAHVHSRYKETRYKDGFAWVDHIAEVKDPRLIAALDDVMVERVVSGKDGSVTLAPPEMIDWGRVRGFRFRESGGTFDDLRMDDFVDSVDASAPLRKSALKSRRVFAVDDAGTPVDVWSLDRCLACELEIGGDTFVRTNGRWYRIERGLVKAVNEAVGALVRPMPSLLPYADAGEGPYNERVAKANSGFVLVDKKTLMHGGGASRIEFCDLFTETKQMIHVKRYCGSQTLSHLFAQGSVGAHLLLTDRDFRKKLDAMLPRTHRVGIGRPDAREYELVYAIIEGSRRPLIEVLPFFSRLMLRNTARQLGALGYTVVAAHVRDGRGARHDRRAHKACHDATCSIGCKSMGRQGQCVNRHNAVDDAIAATPSHVVARGRVCPKTTAVRLRCGTARVTLKSSRLVRASRGRAGGRRWGPGARCAWQRWSRCSPSARTRDGIRWSYAKRPRGRAMKAATTATSGAEETTLTKAPAPTGAT